MVLSNEIQNKIKILFKNDDEFRERLLSMDVNAIRKIASISQKGINPKDVVQAFENKDYAAMNRLYNQSKRLVELQELYKELCYEFYKNIKEDTERPNDKGEIFK